MVISAKYPGKCATCGQPFAAGDKICWERGKPTTHAACAANAPAPAPISTPAPAPVAPALPADAFKFDGGYAYYNVGDFVKRTDADGNDSFCVVLALEFKYGGKTVTARPATDAEIAAYLIRERKKAEDAAKAEAEREAARKEWEEERKRREAARLAERAAREKVEFEAVPF
jgi:hypothetical protein